MYRRTDPAATQIPRIAVYLLLALWVANFKGRPLGNLTLGSLLLPHKFGPPWVILFADVKRGVFQKDVLGVMKAGADVISRSDPWRAMMY